MPFDVVENDKYGLLQIGNFTALFGGKPWIMYKHIKAFEGRLGCKYQNN